MGWWSGETKVIPNSTQFKFKLKQELSLDKITVEIVATAALPVDHLMATDCNAAACAYFLTMGVTYQTDKLCKFSNNLCDISGQLYQCIISFSDNVRDISSQLYHFIIALSDNARDISNKLALQIF